MVGINCIYLFLHRSNYFNSLLYWLQHKPFVLPESADPALIWFIGTPMDTIATLGVVMFAHITDGSSPSLSIYGLQFAGQLVGIYTLLVLEGIRVGNQSTIIYYTMAWGLSMQLLSYAFTMPLFCLAHLLTSRTVTALTKTPFRICNRATLETLPIVLLIGYFVPSLAYAIPLPQDLNTLHQWFGGLWQGFPVYISLFQLGIRIWYRFNSVLYTQPSAAIEDFEINALRKVYSFAICSCVATHAPSWMIGLVNMLAPILSRFIGLNNITISAIFIPQGFWSFNQVNMADGIHSLLIYDQIFGSAAILVWAIAINIDGRTYFDTTDIVVFLSKAVGYIILSGPAGAAVWLLWDRDERLWQMLK